MIQKIIDFSIHQKLIIALGVFVLIGWGLYEVKHLPIDAVPDITDNQVQVITVAPSYGALDIERLITFPIEQANSNISGIREMRSFSRFGLSLVTIVFEDDIDVYWARQQVAERLVQVQQIIPREMGIPELGPITTGLGEIYQYVVKPKKGYESKYDATKLRTIQDWIIRRQLLGVQGVAEVSSFGGNLKQWSIEVNPSALHAAGLTIQDVFDALEKNNQNTGGAYIEKGPTVLYIRSEGLIGNQEDLLWIPVKKSDQGPAILLRDIAKITEGHATRFGAMCYNDEGEVAGAVVMMLKGANSNEVIQNIKERIQQIRKSLPPGVEIEAFLDRTKMVNNAIQTVGINLIEGALIVLIILIVFLGNWRAGLLVASVIPLAMLFAVILMNRFGVSGNLMSLGALDFGLIVDGALIIVESVLHRLQSKSMALHSSSSKEMQDEVKSTAGKMMSSAIFGQCIILVVYLPIFSLEGIEGKMFKPMAQTVAFALIGAFVLSLTYIPMMSALLVKSSQKNQWGIADRLMLHLKRWYEKAFHRMIQYPRMVLSSVFALFVLAIFVMMRLGGEFIPALEEGDFAVDTRVLTGSNLNTTIRETQKTAHILLERFPEVEKVVTKIGSGEVPTDPMPMEASDMMVIMKDKKTWKSAKTFDEMAEKMGEALKEIPGVTAGFQYPVQMRFNELMTGARQDVVCKIFGENLDTLSKYAARLGNVVKTIEGVKNVYVEPISGMPQIVIKYNRLAIAQYQTSIEAINRIVNTSFAGGSAGMVYEDEKRFEIVVKLDEGSRNNLQDIRNLLIPCNNDVQVPLQHLASVDIIDGPNQIQREDAKRRIIVGFNVRGRDVEGVVDELKKKINGAIKFPPGYFTVFGGAFENLNEAKKRLSIAVPVSLLLIFVLLFFAFKSVKQALIIYTAIPLSAIGGILLLAIRGMPFSISAGIGFIALFGVAVLNGIVLLAEFNKQRAGQQSNLQQMVLKATQTRLRPVLMTALVASLGFLPMALSQGAGAEVQRPLATVVIGGLVLATLLTLFILPLIYLWMEGAIRMKLNKGKILTALLFFMCCGFSCTFVNAQSNLNLQSAIDRALENNLTMQRLSLENEYWQKISEIRQRTGMTNFQSELGQFNGPAFDVKYGVVQSFSLPAVYRADQAMNQKIWEHHVIQKQISEIQIKAMVTRLFYDILLSQKKLTLLREQELAFTEFFRIAELRHQKGESDLLELQHTKLIRQKIQIAIQACISDIQAEKDHLSFLMNDQNKFEVTNDDLKYLPGNLEQNIDEHPLVLSIQKMLSIQSAKNKLEKMKKLPEISAGYVFQTFRASGELSTVGPILSYGVFSFNLPLFNKSINKRIAAFNVESKAIDIQKTEAVEMLKLKQMQLNHKRAQYDAQVIQYEKEILPATESMKLLVALKFKNGALDYLEWIQSMQEIFDSDLAYLLCIRERNQLLIQQQYLTNEYATE
jgi:cobalt-zinc-cadmium resistance protein CzcA